MKINLNNISESCYINYNKPDEIDLLMDIDDTIEHLQDENCECDYCNYFENKAKTVELLKQVFALCYIKNINLNNYLQISVNSEE